MPDTPPVHVVCAIIQRGDLILLAQRPPGKRLAGLWEFPGGKIEEGETPADALHREIAEELGCQIVVVQPGPPVFHGYAWGTICLQPFFCKLALEAALPEPREHTALAWVSPENLRDYNVAQADLPVIEWLQSILP